MNNMKKKDVNDKLKFMDTIAKKNKNDGLLAILPDTSLQYFSCADSKILNCYKDLEWDNLSGYVFLANNNNIIQYGAHLSDVNHKISEVNNPSQTTKVEVSAASQTNKGESSATHLYTISAKQIQAL